MSSRSIDVRAYVSDGIEENAYIVRGAASGSAVAVDPGGAAGAMAADLEKSGLRLEAILLTHAHFDHVEGVATLVRSTGAPVYLHPADRPLYDRAAEQAALFGIRVEKPPAPAHALEHGQRIERAGVRFEVRHVPGHSPGHVLLYVPDAGIAFVGDVVFAGSIGRTDLPGGDFHELMRSIREHVLSLPDETVLYPGHGPATTVGHERVSNPFLVPQFGGGLA
jgi:glyoxylase-like metal-dependent hydrolase (beta-lactamase superfamily II)